METRLKILSGAGLLLMVAGAVGQVVTHSLFSAHPAVIASQAIAVGLMAWARITFGGRSFHATADPTEGGLVTSGPYAFVRHPIYTAVCLFVLAGGLAHLSWPTAGLVLLVFAGAIARMLAEEHLLRQRYPEYSAYAARIPRMVPYVF
jgi:protein-S-isoprenylcysteine O-methyltransferase Ste14